MKGQFSNSKVIEASYKVAAEVGVRNITFRAISKACGIGLGTLTYHYKDRNEIISEATKYARKRFLRRFREALDSGRDRENLPCALAEMIEFLTVDCHAEMAVEYDFFLSGSDDPALREMCLEWSHENTAALRMYMSESQALIITYQLAGIFLHSSKFGKEFRARDTEPLFRSILSENN